MGWLERMKHLMKTNIGLVNIIAAALLVELVSGVMYPKQHPTIYGTATLLLISSRC